MSEFNPYLKWLGIRDPERPVNHYRLLGIEMLESDPQIISMAADRQMEHVRTFQTGPQGADCQNLLSELAIARRCLLTPKLKTAYDQQLASRIAAAAAAVATAPGVASQATVRSGKNPASPNAEQLPAISASTKTENANPLRLKTNSNLRAERKRIEQRQGVWSLIGWISGAFAAVAVGGWIVTAGVIPGVGWGGEPIAESETVVAQAAMADQTTAGMDSASIARNSISENQSEHPFENDSVANTSAADSKNLGSTVVDNAIQNSNSVDSKDSIANFVPERDGTATNAEPPVFINQKQFADYPFPDSTTRALMRQIEPAVSEKRWKLFESTTDQTGKESEYLNTGPPGTILVGMVYGVFTDGDGTIQSVRPIYLSVDGIQIGKKLGELFQPKFLLAKPGFAVGGIEAAQRNPISGFRLKFMKLNRDRLDPSDAYFSPWVGKDHSQKMLVDNPLGVPIVGLRGNVGGSHVLSIGFIGSDLSSSDNLDIANDLNSPPSDSPESDSIPDPFAVTDNMIAESTTAPIDARYPIPSERELETEYVTIMKDYLSQLQNRKTFEQKNGLAEEMLRGAQRNSPGSPAQYALLKKSWEVAVSIGNAELGCQIISELNDVYQVDAMELNQQTLTMASKNLNADSQALFSHELDRQIETLIANEQFDTAEPLAKLGYDLARRMRLPEATKFYQRQSKRVNQLQALLADNQKAEKILAESPNDPAANTSQGDYLFVVKNKWMLACENWKIGSDEGFQEIANSEMGISGGEVGLEKMLELVELWAAAGKRNKTVRDTACLKRALELCESATFKAEGLEREKIKLRADELKKLLAE